MIGTPHNWLKASVASRPEPGVSKTTHRNRSSASNSLKPKRNAIHRSDGGGSARIVDAMPSVTHRRLSTSQESSQRPSSRKIDIRRLLGFNASLFGSSCKCLLKTETRSFPFKMEFLTSSKVSDWTLSFNPRNLSMSTLLSITTQDRISSSS